MPSISWYKQEIEIQQNKDIIITFDERTYITTLEISNLTTKDEGVYRCIAENIAGSAETSATLTIQRK